MATLSEQEKEEVVRLLACYHTPSQVVVQMRECGVEVDRFQVRSYDPTNARYEAGERWRALFERERTAYLTQVDDIPIAKPAYRLNELQKNYDRASQMGNLVLANAILRQAAWEVGRTPVQRPDMYGAGDQSYRHMTVEERRAKMAEILNDAIARIREDRERAAALPDADQAALSSGPVTQSELRDAA